MVNYGAAGLDATFSALGDPTRRAILARLSQGESSIVELAKPFDFSLPAILKHVRVLEDAGLLARQKNGRVNRCRLRTKPMRDAAAWMEEYRQFWERKIGALANFLEQSQKEEDRTWQRHKKIPKGRYGSGERSPRRARKSSKRGRGKNC
jgi:DNA-binding transcriptional ArsR family regulator